MAVAAVLLAVRDASARAAAGTRGAGRRLARLQVWLGKPEALLFREGCQLLACLMFILLYVWRYASVLLYLQLVLSDCWRVFKVSWGVSRFPGHHTGSWH